MGSIYYASLRPGVYRSLGAGGGGGGGADGGGGDGKTRATFFVNSKYLI